MRYCLTLLVTFVFCGTLHAETLWIDVRSEREYLQDNIEGHLRIDHTKVQRVVAEQFPDKNTDIKLYCRSGRRAGIAMNALQMAGYSNVTNIGGIADAKTIVGTATGTETAQLGL